MVALGEGETNGCAKVPSELIPSSNKGISLDQTEKHFEYCCVFGPEKTRKWTNTAPRSNENTDTFRDRILTYHAEIMRERVMIIQKYAVESYCEYSWCLGGQSLSCFEATKKIIKLRGMKEVLLTVVRASYALTMKYMYGSVAWPKDEFGKKSTSRPSSALKLESNQEKCTPSTHTSKSHLYNLQNDHVCPTWGVF